MFTSIILLFCAAAVYSLCPFTSRQFGSKVPHSDPFYDERNAMNITELFGTRYCDESYPYVRPSGECNKLSVPLDGSLNTPYARFASAHYDDGVHSIRRNIRHKDLKSARFISNAVAHLKSYSPAPEVIINHGALMWGLMIIKDIAFNDAYQPKFGDNEKHCCSDDNRYNLPEHLRNPDCMSITDNDPNDWNSIGCVDFMRTRPLISNAAPGTPALLPNAMTAYMDNSNIYGSSAELLVEMRSMEGGTMKIDEFQILGRKEDCEHDHCYITGDYRGLKVLTATVWHSICVRLHNVIAGQLAAINPHWDDERIFQETRRAATAVYQAINYNEWLPLVLGEEEAVRAQLTCPAEDAYCGEYDESVSAQASEEISMGAFRVFHINLPTEWSLYDENYNILGKHSMNDVATTKATFLKESFSPVLRGMLADPALYDTFPDYLREFILNDNDTKLDVLAMDIARQRDHGLAPFTYYYERCSGRQVNSWADLMFDFSPENIRAMRELYASPKDVDLFVGLLLEEKRNAILGPVSVCMVSEQMYRTKHGDRFFYSFPNGAYPFSVEQLASINSLTMADVLCLTTDLGQVPPRTFEPIGENNRLEECAFKSIDYELWKDRF